MAVNGEHLPIDEHTVELALSGGYDEDCEAVVREYVARLAELVSTLEAALTKYGKHVYWCPWAPATVIWFDGVRPTCSCGFADAKALAGLGADPATQETAT